MEVLEKEFERAPPSSDGAEPPDTVYGEVIPLFAGYLKSVEICRATGAITEINVVPIRNRREQFPGLPKTVD